MSTSTARTFDELESLRATWRAFEWPRLDPELDYFVAVARARPEVIRPHVAILRHAGDPVGMAVARLEQVPLAVNVGYRPVYGPRVRALTVVHGGIAAADEGNVRPLVDELRGALTAGEADVAILPALRIDGPVYRAAVETGSAFTRHVEPSALHWRLRLPGSPEELIAGLPQNLRKNLHGLTNRLSRDHGEGEVRVHEKRSDLPRLLDDLEHVAEKTYQRGLGVAFADDAARRPLAELGLEQGWYRAYVLAIGGEPVAYYEGAVHRRTFFPSTTGYDPEYARYGVGTLLMIHMLERLSAGDEVDAVDFGFGHAEYKRRLANEHWEERDVLLFAPSFRAIRVNLTRAAILAGVRSGKRTLAHTGLDQRLKTAWRKRLSDTPT